MRVRVPGPADVGVAAGEHDQHVLVAREGPVMVRVLHQVVAQKLVPVTLLQEHRYLRGDRPSVGVASRDEGEGMLADEPTEYGFIVLLMIWQIVNGLPGVANR